MIQNMKARLKLICAAAMECGIESAKSRTNRISARLAHRAHMFAPSMATNPSIRSSRLCGVFVARANISAPRSICWYGLTVGRGVMRSIRIGGRIRGRIRVCGEGECFLPESTNSLKRDPRRANLPPTGESVYRTSFEMRPDPSLRETRPPRV